tara:strand:- start:220 stop:507 length:288 start_codon:yes stop_codon:yes gene_type:complete
LSEWKNSISQYLEIEDDLVSATGNDSIRYIFSQYRANRNDHQYVKRRIRNIVQSSTKSRRVNKFLTELYEYKQYKNLNKERNENENKNENRATGI